MNKMIDIIRKMQQPLQFSAKEGFRHLPLVKDLGRAMTTLGRELNQAIQESIPIKDDGSMSSLESLFTGFDQQNIDEKKTRISKALGILNHLSQWCPDVDSSSASPVPPAELDWEKLAQPVQFIKGIGPKIAGILERKNIRVVEDLLYFLPRRYEDRRRIKTIAMVAPGVRETIVGRIIEARLQQYRHKKVFEAAVNDGTGVLTATWFKGNPAYLKNTFKNGQEVILTGDVRLYNGGKTMIHPDYEILDEKDDPSLHFRRIVPIYSETEGLHQKTLRRMAMRAVEDYALYVQSPLPEWICTKYQLPSIGESIRSVHFPSDDADMDTLNDGKSIFHRRLIYDEFFFFELGMAMKKQGHVFEAGIAFKTGGPLVKQFYKMLPFAFPDQVAAFLKQFDHTRPDGSETNEAQGYRFHGLFSPSVDISRLSPPVSITVMAVCQNKIQAITRFWPTPTGLSNDAAKHL